MTWKQFKDYLEQQGIKDEDVIWYFDFNGSQLEELRLERQVGDNSFAVWA